LHEQDLKLLSMKKPVLVKTKATGKIIKNDIDTNYNVIDIKQVHQHYNHDEDVDTTFDEMLDANEDAVKDAIVEVEAEGTTVTDAINTTEIDKSNDEVIDNDQAEVIDCPVVTNSKIKRDIPDRRNHVTMSGRRTNPTWKIANAALYKDLPTTDDTASADFDL
jgi:hypothetical protein